MSDIGPKAIGVKVLFTKFTSIIPKKLIWITRFPHSVTLRLRDIIGL